MFSKELAFFIVGYCLALLQDYIKLFVRPPKITIGFDSSSPKHILETDLTAPKFGKICDVTYLKISVRNEGFRQATNCLPVLTKIERLDSADKPIEELHYTPLTLEWAYHGVGPMNLAAGQEILFDLLKIFSKKLEHSDKTEILPDQLHLTVSPLPTYIRNKFGKGRYRFEATVYQDQFKPRIIRLTVDWKGNYKDNIEISNVQIP